MCIKNEEFCTKNDEICSGRKIEQQQKKKNKKNQGVEIDASSMVQTAVSRNDEFCIKNEEFCIKNEEIFI